MSKAINAENLSAKKGFLKIVVRKFQRNGNFYITGSRKMLFKKHLTRDRNVYQCLCNMDIRLQDICNEKVIELNEIIGGKSREILDDEPTFIGGKYNKGSDSSYSVGFRRFGFQK